MMDIVFETDQTKAITLLTSMFGDKTTKYDESFHSPGTDLHKSMFDSYSTEVDILCDILIRCVLTMRQNKPPPT